MIEVTPDILGPGIEEEYSDALAAIDDMRVALGLQKLTNSTPEGRVLLNIAWLEKEIHSRRLPIPIDESYAQTIFHLVGSNELAGFPGFQEALGRLWLVLKGYGLVKPRHTPLLISMMDDFTAEAERCPDASAPKTAALIADMRAEADRLRRGEWPRRRRLQQYFTLQITPSLRACMERCSGRATDIQAALFEDWRPSPAYKPALPAPTPGLPPKAPSLPPELEGRLP